MEEEETSRSDYFMAQIAMEVARSRSKNPEKLKLEDFVLQIRRRGGSAPSKSQVVLSKEEATKKSKSAWGAFLGSRRNKTKKPKN